jgi:hypothetical protein
MDEQEFIEGVRDEILEKVDQGEIKLNENDALYGASLFMDAAVGDITVEQAVEMFIEHSDYTISVTQQ